jgi:hypothetical protein
MVSHEPWTNDSRDETLVDLGPPHAPAGQPTGRPRTTGLSQSERRAAPERCDPVRRARVPKRPGPVRRPRLAASWPIAYATGDRTAGQTAIASMRSTARA